MFIVVNGSILSHVTSICANPHSSLRKTTIYIIFYFHTLIRSDLSTKFITMESIRALINIPLPSGVRV